MDLTETVTGSTRLYDGKIVNLRVDDVRLPNGKTSKREIVEHAGAVAIVPITATGDVLLIRQFRLPAGGVLWEIPAGGREPGESPEVCARRELGEEIGKQPQTLTPLFTAYLAPGYSTELMHGFLARDLRDAPGEKDEDEFLEVVSMPLSDALAKIATGEIQDIKTIAGLTLAARQLAL